MTTRNLKAGWYFPTQGRKRVSHWYGQCAGAPAFARSHCGQVITIKHLSTDAVTARGKCKPCEDGRAVADRHGTK